MWVLYAFLSAFFAGITAILAKLGIQQVSSQLATAIRTIVVLVFSWFVVFVTGTQSGMSCMPGKSLLFLLLSGLATGASWLCYFRALQLGTVNKVTPIDKSSTVLTMLLAFLFLHEPISWIKAGCMLLIGSGTLLMIQKAPGSSATEPKSKKWLRYAVASAVFASLTAILGKIGVETISSHLATAIRTIVVLVMAWILVFANGRHREIRTIDKKSWIFLLLSGAATGLSWLCYYRALQDGDAAIVVPIDKLSVVLTVLFAALFLGERPSWKVLLGLLLLTAGTLLLLVPAS